MAPIIAGKPSRSRLGATRSGNNKPVTSLGMPRGGLTILVQPHSAPISALFWGEVIPFTASSLQ